MYSAEDKRRAVELFIKYDLSCASVINELGYPSRGSLYEWYRSYLEYGDSAFESNGYRRYTDRQKRDAVDYFFDHGKCIARTIRALGYPRSKELLASWIDELEPGLRPKRATGKRYTEDQVNNAVVELEARNLPAAAIAAELGVERATLYQWKKRLLGEEAPCRMPKDDVDLPDDAEELKEQIRELKEQVRKLELKKAILEGTVELLGKDPGVDPSALTNREKVALVDSLRPAHKLKDILDEIGMPRSSYQYQREAASKPYKYAALAVRICQIFQSSGGAYGYRRIHRDLRNEGVTVSEKVVAAVMKREGLVARHAKRRRYSSYKGEIGEAPDNLVKRNFHADAPNRLWLTDITEFRIPAGKVYLSPIVDCFDGMVVSWATSTSPNADLANDALDAAIESLKPGEHPVGHSDRGCHYRWPGWIERCERHGIVRSMSKKGCSPDNSAMEGFFGRMKVEFFYGRCWDEWSVEDFMDAIDDYIHWYNEGRIKLSLGGMSPVQYRQSLGLAA